MRYLILALALVLGPSLSARAQLSVDIGGAGFNIGINMPVYPQLVLIPGYPVYYDPYVNSNYFFYDGLYWVYSEDNWYASTWYNGPWDVVAPEYVPQFLLLIPVRYYRAPPVYFRSWYRDAPPRWGEHWGRTWEQRRAGWDRWDRRSVAAAPLPLYQRQYSGDRYPRAIQQQQAIQSQNYRYQPRDAVAQQHFRQRAAQGGQPQGNAGRTRAQTQQPAQQQGAVPQAEQQRAQVNRQRQQQQQYHQQQQQSTQAQPTQRMRQERPAQSAVQTQPHIQNGPQGRGPAGAGSPQAKGAETRAAPREIRAAPQASGPQGGGAQNRGGPQEARGGPQGKGGEKGAREGKVKEDKN